jgi:hypothetical protein
MRQALFFRGSGAPESINKDEFLPKIFTSRKFCAFKMQTATTLTLATFPEAWTLALAVKTLP